MLTKILKIMLIVRLLPLFATCAYVVIGVSAGAFMDGYQKENTF